MFTQFHVIEFKQLVPFAKTTELHELYEMHFDNGKIDSLKKKLENTHLFRFVKKIPILVPTYDPTDYMWYLTTEDPDIWLCEGLKESHDELCSTYAWVYMNWGWGGYDNRWYGISSDYTLDGTTYNNAHMKIIVDINP